jgi:outer membrane protein assembly factor BamD
MFVTSPSFSFLRSPVITGLLCFVLLGLNLGKTQAADDGETVRKLYQKAQRLVAEGDSEEALDRFLTLSQKYPQSEWAPASLWEVYRISVHLGDDEAAFEALNRLIIGQPGHFEKAHSAQLQLVKRLLGGGKETRRSLEPVRKSQTTPPEIIQEMLKTIIKNGPQSEVGIQAHYYLGIALEKSGEFKEAIAMHEDFAETYPQHELADDAGYQVGYIAYKQWKTMRSTGPHQRENAAIYLAWFIAKFPESDKVAQARSCLSEVRSSELRELMSLARFYESRGNEKAAAIYHEQIASRFPEAVIADKDLQIGRASCRERVS